MIGASLIEPHTSVTALLKCVCVCLLACLLACLRPYTVNFKCAFKYFLKFNVIMHGNSQSAASATGAKTAEVEARTATSCLSWQLRT